VATYLVAGATGKTGQRVALELLAHGLDVRALVHQHDDRSKLLRSRGAEVVEVDLLNSTAVQAVARGVTAAYFCFPPESGLLTASKVFADALASSGAEHVVALSQYHARQGHPSPLTQQHWEAERYFEASGIAVTHLRSNYFMEVYGLVCAGTIATMNRFFLPYGDSRWAPVAAGDVARLATLYLIGDQDPPLGAVRVRGPEALSQRDIASVFAYVLDREIFYVDIPLDHWREMGRLQGGLSDFLLEHHTFTAQDVRAGRFEAVDDGVPCVVPPDALTFENYVTTTKEVWRLDNRVETPVQTFYEGRLFDPLGTRAGREPLATVPSYGLPPTGTNFSLDGVDLSNRTVEMTTVDGACFFGDCLNVVDAPDETALDEGLPAFGWSGDQLLGGFALTTSELTGRVRIEFGSEENGFLPFVVRHPGGLAGTDSSVLGSDGYELRSVNNNVTDLQPWSHGRLELQTGRVFDFHYNVAFYNSALERLVYQNPWLTPPPLMFGGPPHAGHAIAWMERETLSDRLVLHVAVQMFLPLGSGSPEHPLTLPPSESGKSFQNPVRAANSSLHPYLYLAARSHEQLVDRSGRVPEGQPDLRSLANDRLPGRPALPTGSRGLRPELLENRQFRFVCLPSESHFGDDFVLRSRDLGGGGFAQSPLFGHVLVQVGGQNGAYLPLVFRFSSPPGLEMRCAAVLRLLPPGSIGGLVGMHGDLQMGDKMYPQGNLCLQTDPYKLSIALVHALEGSSACSLVSRAYLYQDLMLALLRTEARTPSDSFAYVGDVSLFETESGALGLRLSARFEIPYPAGYLFPLPDGGSTRVESGSQLYPFVNLLCVEEGGFSTCVDDAHFVGERHLRGNLVAPLSMKIMSGSTGTTIHVESERTTLYGKGEQIRELNLGAHRYRYGTFAMRQPGSEDPETCLCVVTDDGVAASLQMISARESFDTWMEGELQ
jgi:NAD(P)H dehydrogenase (quinone)